MNDKVSEGFKAVSREVIWSVPRGMCWDDGSIEDFIQRKIGAEICIEATGGDATTELLTIHVNSMCNLNDGALVQAIADVFAPYWPMVD